MTKFGITLYIALGGLLIFNFFIINGPVIFGINISNKPGFEQTKPETTIQLEETAVKFVRKPNPQAKLEQVEIQGTQEIENLHFNYTEIPLETIDTNVSTVEISTGIEEKRVEESSNEEQPKKEEGFWNSIKNMENEKILLLARILFSAIFIVFALLVVIFGNPKSPLKKWAYGILNIIAGFWLNTQL